MKTGWGTFVSWRWAASIFPLMHHPNWTELSGWAVSFNNSPPTHTKGVVNANLLGDIRAWAGGWAAKWSNRRWARPRLEGNLTPYPKKKKKKKKKKTITILGGINQMVFWPWECVLEALLCCPLVCQHFASRRVFDVRIVWGSKKYIKKKHTNGSGCEKKYVKNIHFFSKKCRFGWCINGKELDADPNWPLNLHPLI